MRKLLWPLSLWALLALGCGPAQEQDLCDNAKDDDNDDLADCDDPDCALDPACVETNCDDVLDNDNDGAVDCQDDDCADSPDCQVGPELCDNLTDDDADLLIDCEDPSCQADATCAAAISAACAAAISAAISAQPSNTDDTTKGTNLFAGSDACNFGVTGDNSPEDIFVFTPAADTLTLTLTPLDAPPNEDDLALYVRSVCDQIDSEIDCEDSGGGATPESLALSVTIGQPIFLFVDGFLGDFGPYTLTIE